MKFKIFLLIIICSFFGILIAKQDKLIRIPKDERELIQVSEKLIKGKVIKVNDGDTFEMENNIKVRLFAIDAPELSQTCLLNLDPTQTEKDNKNEKDESLIIKQEEIKCGQEAKDKLIDLIGDNEIACLVKGKDAYDRFVADCGFEKYNKRTQRKDRININKEMVLSGYAVAFQQISDKYLEDENIAKAQNKGIWATSFEMPSTYRKRISK